MSLGQMGPGNTPRGQTGQARQLGRAILGTGARFVSVKKRLTWASLHSWGLNLEAGGLLRRESPPSGLQWWQADACEEPLLTHPLPELDKGCHSDTLLKEV